MNGPGGYEWLRGEGAQEVPFIDESSNAATPQYLLQPQTHAKTVSIDNVQESQFIKPHAHSRTHARTHTVM